ncbi:MAG: YkgJ family cysteine cluster protein [Syntrophobacteraceae bacterium]
MLFGIMHPNRRISPFKKGMIYSEICDCKGGVMTLEDQDRENLISLCSEAMDTYGQVDRVAEEVIQLVNSSGEHRIACRRGCNTCCTVFVRVTFAEAAAIAQWLFEPSNAIRLCRFREKTATWRTAVGPEVEMLEALATRHDIHLDSGSDSQLFAEALRTYHRRKLMCPFNADDGSCGIYTFRPVVCRAYFVVDTSENCGLDAYGEAGVVRHAKLTDVVLLGQRALKQASAAVGYGTISALPVGVHRAILILERRHNS